jgi:hypothetical protein
MWARSCLRVMLPGHRRPRKSGQCLQFLLSASPRSSWWRLSTWLLLTIKPRYDGVLDHGCGGADIWRCSLGRGLRRLLVRSKWASTRPSRCRRALALKATCRSLCTCRCQKATKKMTMRQAWARTTQLDLTATSRAAVLLTQGSMRVHRAARDCLHGADCLFQVRQ